MTDRDVTQARDQLGMASVMDLRQQQAIGWVGRGPLVDDQMRYHHFPLIEQDKVQAVERFRAFGSLSKSYLHDLADPKVGRQIAKALEALADAEAYPAVFHCMAGKDSTGLLAAVVLGTLGVVDEEIVSDYARRSRHVAVSGP